MESTLPVARQSEDRLTDAQGIIKARHLMSWILIDMNAPDEAEEHLLAADMMVAQAPDYAEHQIAHMACLRLHQGEQAEALLLAEELLSPSRRDISLANQAIGCYVRGSVSLAAGQKEQAADWCQLGQTLAVQSDVPAVMNLLTRLRVQIHSAT